MDNLLNTMRRAGRGGSTAAEGFMYMAEMLVQAGWAVMVRTDDYIRLLICTPDQKAIIDLYPGTRRPARPQHH